MSNKTVGIEYDRTTSPQFESEYQKIKQQQKDNTARYLLYTLLASLAILFVMLAYVISEYVQVKNANAEILQKTYAFGADLPFYMESAEAYLRFMLRFIIIYSLISGFGIFSIITRRPWLYLLIILMSVISVVYFLLL